MLIPPVLQSLFNYLAPIFLFPFYFCNNSVIQMPTSDFSVLGFHCLWFYKFLPNQEQMCRKSNL